MQSESSYWGNALRGRLSRRRAIGAGLGAAATLAIGCGQKKTESQSAAPAETSAGSANRAPQRGGTYNFYQISNPPTLDPQRTTSYFTQQPVGAVYSRLLRVKTGPDPKAAEANDVEGDLAAGAESPDATTWTFKLRPEAKFQNVPPLNGRGLEAEDVKASFMRALDPKNPNGGSLGMIDAAQISTPDSHTVVFKLKYPYAPFTKIVASPLYAWILSREALAGAYDPTKQLIGSGPFLFDSYTPDVAFSFKRNPDWFEKGRPYVDGAHYAIIPDSAQQVAQFKAGNLDELSRITANNLDTVKRDNPKATLYTGSPDTVYALCGQLGDPTSPWADVRVRHAFSMLLDRAGIGAAAYGDKATPQAVVPLSYGKWALKPQDLDPNLAQNYKYDVAAAKKLLGEAGATNLSLKLAYAPNGYAQPYATIAETVSSMINAAGIKTNLVAVDYNSEYVNGGKGYRFGNFPKDTLVFGVGTGGYTEIDEILFAYYDSKSDRRNSQINDPTFDAMLDKGRMLVNESDRLKAYLDIQRYLVDKMYFITGWPGQPAYRMVQPWVQDYNYSAGYGFFAESEARLWLQKS
jgi:peptide/nickel transport system substrate-binding protein